MVDFLSIMKKYRLKLNSSIGFGRRVDRREAVFLYPNLSELSFCFSLHYLIFILPLLSCLILFEGRLLPDLLLSSSRQGRALFQRAGMTNSYSQIIVKGGDYYD